MPLKAYAADFQQALYDATLASIERVAQAAGSERDYAFALYTAGGYPNFSVAAVTEESFARRPKHPGGLDPKLLEALQDHSDLLAMAMAMVDADKDYSDSMRITADEWEYLEIGHDLFNRVNDLTDEIHQVAADLDWSVTGSFFLVQARETLRRIRAAQPFQGPAFAADVFLSLQSSDMDKNELEQI
jgi:hypothetical protein